MNNEKLFDAKRKFLIAFGNEIRKLRKAQNMTQEELGERCFGDKQKIGRVERGEYDFSFSSFPILAKALGIDPYTFTQFDFVKEYMSVIIQLQARKIMQEDKQ